MGLVYKSYTKNMAAPINPYRTDTLGDKQEESMLGI